MATPTPSSAPQKRPLGGPSTPATGGVSTPKAHATPSNSAFGSGVSPSTQRVTASPAKRGAQLAGKSPYSNGTPTKTPNLLGGRTFAGSSPASNHPTGSSLGANGVPLGFESPATLLGALGGTAMESGLSGGVGMGITMSSLGLTASALGRVDDEERRRKLELVLQTLRRRPGLVSAEGLERLCKRCGLSFMEDARADGKHTLSMAGETFLLDVDIAQNQPNNIDRVALTFPSATADVTNYAEKAAKVLKKDLQPDSRTKTALVTLDNFAENLERLARLDKLSMSGVNCFEAISGVYTSLKRLYEYEKEIVEGMMKSGELKSNVDAENEVLCKRSGKPKMHANGKFGLSLDYWIGNHLLSNPSDISNHETNITENPKILLEPDKPTIFSLIIECESSLATLYPPIRNSKEWISDDVMKVSKENGDDLDMQPNPIKVIDWLDPPASMIATVPPNPEESENGFDHGQSRARFVAKLDPPIALPFSVATQILNSVNVTIPQDPTRIAMYDLFVLPDGPSQTAIVSGEGEQREIHLTRKVFTANDIDGPYKEYLLNVMFPKREVAFKLEELPFEHPRQIIHVLPLLRQHAFIASLFQKSCQPLIHSSGSGTFVGGQPGTSEFGTGLSPKSKIDIATEFEASELPLALDIVFCALPIPRLTMLQCRERGNGKVALAIMANAELTVLDQNYVQRKPNIHTASDLGTDSQRVEKDISNLGKALALSEDLVIWAEWTRRAYRVKNEAMPNDALDRH